MWVLQTLDHSSGKSVTRSYAYFAQLALDDENFPIVQDLADNNYMRWTEEEEPLPLKKLSKALYETGCMERTLADGTEYKLSLIVAQLRLDELLEDIMPILLVFDFVNRISPN
jgi:hypothetical protein